MADAFQALQPTGPPGWAGSPWFFLALNLVAVARSTSRRALSTGFPDALTLVMTTALTVVTQLMVCLIQATQNRDGRAIHLKLDELLRAIAEARTELARAEDMAGEEVERGSGRSRKRGEGSEPPS